ncbi:uncharacterized protein [Macrobrachium rosenbergii]|uniref:uncharacterized protein n=1 Tax=Macrobrachium rosenbergii TaxID=79674 RepID=UPI0034D7147B
MAVLTSIEDVQPFINRETLEVDIESLKKDELLLIAEYGGLDVSRADRKQVIKLVVMKYLCLEADSIDEDKPVPDRKDEDPKPVQSRRGSRGSRSSLVEGDNVDDDDEVSETGKDRDEITKLQLQIKLKQLENEAKEKDREDREKERKHEERQRERELKLAQLKFGGRNKGSDESFDLIHNIKLVPKFSERVVSKFFASFEKVAKQMKWPVENWTIMLQVVLVGKAQAAYSALSVEDSSNYELVKDVILKAYALVPEAYRQKFRELKKASNETYSEFARCKERLFEDWCNSRKVGNMQDMRELILLEEFKNCVPKDLKAHLEETQVETLKVATRTSDEYSLTHKKVYEGETRVEAGKNFMNKPGSEEEVVILRDTGAAQTLLLESVVPPGVEICENEVVLLGGFPDSVVSCPLITVKLKCSIIEGEVKVAVVKNLPIVGIGLVLGNDLAKGKVGTDPLLICNPVDSEFEKPLDFVDLPVSAVTRAQSKELKAEEECEIGKFFEDQGNGKNELELNGGEVVSSMEADEWSRESLVREQKGDPEVSRLREIAERGGKEGDLYYLKEDILFRKCSSGEWRRVDQIVVPEKFRSHIMRRGHEDIFAGHVGISKTLERIRRNFYWTKMKKDIARFCKSCHICQLTGKPNEIVPKAPLIPVPSIGEPFQHILIDVVGPLPRASAGKEFILTKLERVSRYPEAIPLKSIKAPVIVKCLVDFFSRYGLPKTIQSDQGSNFMSKYFKDQMKQLGIKHIVSTTYHPESQGAIERFHQTLKSMIKKYCIDNHSSWVTDLLYLLFAVRSMPNDSLGFSSFELIFGHHVRGPLEVLRDSWESEEPNSNILEWVSNSRSRLFAAWELAKDTIVKSQRKMKEVFDVKTKCRTFKEGDKVLILLSLVENQLQAKFVGPYEIEKKINDSNYVVNTPDRKKKQWVCHINMLKLYCERKVEPSMLVQKEAEESGEEFVEIGWTSSNLEILKNLKTKLSHLSEAHRVQLVDLILSYEDMFKDVPGRTHLIEHDVEVEGASPIKQYPYRLNPYKSGIVEKEVEYMLQHNLIRPSYSPWSSPVVLVPKENNQFRLCFDYRKVNNITKTDTYPLPRVDDCIDRVGMAKFISKFDLLKGYWQVPLTERAKAISAFVTPNGLYECDVMPFGMKNAASTFQRLMNHVTRNIRNCVVYIDDVVLYSNTWTEHMQQIKEFFEAIRNANLVINLSKSDFGHAKVTYLGHEVGYGNIRPKHSNVEAVMSFPVPKTRKNVMQFLGLAGYYRRFVSNFSDIAQPLTNLLKKDVAFSWNDSCQDAFNKLKSILVSDPVLKSPDFSQPFKLAVDASDVGELDLDLYLGRSADFEGCDFGGSLVVAPNWILPLLEVVPEFPLIMKVASRRNCHTT